MKDAVRRLLAWLIEPDHDPQSGQTDGLVGLLRYATRAAVLLVGFVFLHGMLMRLCRLPAEAYRGPSILWEIAQRHSALLIVGLLAGSILIVLLPRLRQGWSQFEGGASLRWFIGVLSAVLAWSAAASARNAYFDQTYLAERALLIAFAALVFWRPLFVLPLVACFWAFVWQLDHPPLGFSSITAAFVPLVKVLTLFVIAFLLRAAGGGRRMNDWLFLTICLVAASFWVPGLAKLRIGWITHGHLHLMLPAAYTHGWLAFLSPETISTFTRALAHFDWPMRIGALLIECSALFMFLTARFARCLLVAFVLLLGTFFLTIGYLFWQWMILLGALWILLFRRGDEAASAWRRALFTPARFVLSVIVIGGSSYWFAPARLAWFDTPLTTTLRLEGVGRNGTSCELPPDFFAPYESQLAMSGFVAGLTKEPTITGPYGVTFDRALAARLVAARSPEDIQQIECTVPGSGLLDEEFAKQFDEFIRRTVVVWNRSATPDQPRGRFGFLRPPPFLWTFGRGNPCAATEPIQSVRILRVSSFFDGQHYILFRSELLRTVEISEPTSASRRP